MERVRPFLLPILTSKQDASTKSLLVERVRPASKVWGISLDTGLQRSRSWWSESGDMRKLLCFASGLLQRSRSWWSESGCWRAKSSPFLVGFNEVAPGGASQAPLARLFRAVLLEASTKSLLVERVRRSPTAEPERRDLLQRRRSWWSESGGPPGRSQAIPHSLQRSRSWWSESGLCRSTLCSARQCFNEVAPGGASQASAGPRFAQLASASTKSLLVERVRPAARRARC